MIPQRVAGMRPLARPAAMHSANSRVMLHHGLLQRPATQVHPRLPAWRTSRSLQQTSQAWESSTVTEEKSGHIQADQNESLLFFDNIFPLKLTFLFRRPWKTDAGIADLLRRFDNSNLGVLDPINLVKRAIPQDIPMKVTEILPRLKDGGAFVKVSHGPDVTAEDLEGSLSKKLDMAPLKPWFNPFRGVKAGLVKGVPWLEDLYRFPKTRLRVEFTPKEPGGEAVELSQEDLYSLFRKYGKIADISSQPPDDKVTPKYAHLDFALLRDAIMARNCLHGYLVTESLGGGAHGTKLRLSYEQKVKAHSIWNWIINHPRLVIPVIAGLLAALTVAVFDPIRQFFVKAHILRSFDLTDNRVYKWVKSQTNDILSLGKNSDKAGHHTVWNHRRDLIEQIQTWLMESSDTFIVVQGPRGSGKKELVMDQSLEGRKNVLVIDCKPIAEARGESGTIKNLATATGYRPVFSWANNMSSMIDLAVQSTTGVKSGFSETLESQIVKILHTTASAMKEISLSRRNKHDKDADLSDDAYLEAHPEKRPVVVIDNFLHKNEDSAVVYDKMAQWAALLVQNNVAHVVFLTSDGSYAKPLSKVMPDRVFRQVALGDLSPEVAKKFVASRLEGDENESKSKDDNEKTPQPPKPDLSELDDCIDLLGGRLTDLEFLSRRIKGGQTPKRAVEEIINQSATEIVKMFLSGSKDAIEDRNWSTEQAWYLVKALAKKDKLRYNEVLLDNTFASSLTSAASSGENALEGLTNAELITVKTHHGRPQTIMAGKPMYQAAFGVLLDDPALKAKMDLAILAELVKIETKNIEKVEGELALLAGLPRQPAQTGGRVSYLLDKVDGSQRKIASYEREMGGLKKILAQRY